MTISSIFESTVLPILPELPTVLSTLKTCLEIKKHLGGKEPKSIEIKENGVHIKNNSRTINVFNLQQSNVYFSSNEIEETTSRLLNFVNKDEDRTDINFSFNNTTENDVNSISFSKDELPIYKNLLTLKNTGKSLARM